MVKIADIVANAQEEIEKTEECAEPLDNYRHLLITEHSDVPDPVPVISIEGEIISTPGNITAVSGQAKSGKSAFLQPVIAGALVSNPKDQLDGLEVFPSSGKTVLHIDTEQSRAKHKKSLKAIIHRAGLNESPAHFLSYNFLALDSSRERQDALKAICEAAAAKFGGIHLLVIDGIADLIDDVLDAKESTAVVNLVQGLATKYHCPAIVIIHLNPAPMGQAPKERGHLGSHLQRKAESLLQITSDGDISTLEPKLLRMAGKGKIPLLQFSYDPGRGYHVFVGHKESDKRGASVKVETYGQWAEQALSSGITLTHKDLIKKLETVTNRGYESCKKYLKDMLELELVKKSSAGYYLNHNKGKG